MADHLLDHKDEDVDYDERCPLLIGRAQKVQGEEMETAATTCTLLRWLWRGPRSEPLTSAS